MLSTLRFPAFRYTWFADTGSSVGDWFNLVALAQVVFTSTGTPELLALLYVSRRLVGAIAGPAILPLIERLDARKVLIAADIARAILAASLIPVSMDRRWLPGVFVIAILMSVVSAATNPLYNALIPETLPEEYLLKANSLIMTSIGAAGAFGALLGGLAVGITPSVAFTVNALSFVWSAAWISMLFRALPSYERTRGATHCPKSVRTYGVALLSGFVAASRNKWLLTVFFCTAAWAVCSAAYYLFIPVAANTLWNVGSLGVGLAYATDGLGAIAGSALLGSVRWPVFKNRSVTLLVLYLVQSAFAFGVIRSGNLVAALLWIFALRLCGGLIGPFVTHLLQCESDRETRARVFMADQTIDVVLMQCAFVASGVLLQHTSTLTMASVTIGSSIIIIVAWYLWFTLSGCKLPESSRAVN